MRCAGQRGDVRDICLRHGLAPYLIREPLFRKKTVSVALNTSTVASNRFSCIRRQRVTVNGWNIRYVHMNH